jgi:hypothetical protein
MNPKTLDQKEAELLRDQLALRCKFLVPTASRLTGEAFAEPALSGDVLLDIEKLQANVTMLETRISSSAASPAPAPAPAPARPAAATPAKDNTAPAAKPAAVATPAKKLSLDAQCAAVREDRKAKRASEAALAAEALTLVKAGKMNLTQAVAFVKSKQAGKQP